MSRYDVMVARHKHGIANSFYGEMAGLARDLETENYRLQEKARETEMKIFVHQGRRKGKAP